MSIRRKSTAHDLATLRLHPDGSRVQQSSANARRRTAAYTTVDPRGNWIASDAGGTGAVKRRRKLNVRPDDVERETIDLSGGEDAPSQSKGKQRARDSQTPDENEPESERLSTRARQRLSFMRDLSFLAPLPPSVSSLEQDLDGTDPVFSFPDPSPDLLKSIHHFASCYYRERGELLDSSRDYRGMKRARHTRSQENIHMLAAKSLGRSSIGSEVEDVEAQHEADDEDEDEDESEPVDGEQLKTGDGHRKDMYKAFDGSALLALGIVLQEYVAYTLRSESTRS